MSADLEQAGVGRFGDYLLGERIGEGGFADVFRAEHTSGERPEGGAGGLVVKRLHAHLCEQPEMVDMFVTEARVLAELDHPAIVRMLGLEREGAQWAMVMELIDGVDLARLFDHAMLTGSPVPLTAAIRVVADVADALHHAHERVEQSGDETLGIIHRDVKPDNVLVTRDGHVKLIDFGCAKATLQGHLTRPGIRKGTLDYMSPEQCLGRPVDRRTDIFSLGVVLYELLTMSRLYADASDARVMERIVHEVARPPSWLDDRVSPSLDLVVLRAIEKRPEDRFSTAAEMSRALNWWLDRYAPRDDGHQKMAAWIEAHWQRDDGGATTTRRSDALRPQLAAKPSGDLVLRRGSPNAAPGIRRSVVSHVEGDGTDGPGRSAVVPEERFATLQELLGRRTNLSPEPGPLTPRPALVNAVEEAYAAGAQIVSLIGPAGIGKSRIADDVLRRTLTSSRRMSGGIWWCRCDDVVNDAELTAVVAASLGLDVPDVDHGAIPTVADALGARGPTRICLDGASQFDEDAAYALMAWCDAAPELEILMTARRELVLPRTVAIEVPPLNLPSRASVMLGSEAATFFIDAVRREQPDFEVGERLRAPLHALLRELGGNPAAILVAAAEFVGADPADAVMRLLAAHRPPPERQRALDADTLGAALAWAVNQLSPAEAQMLAAASLFHGGFDAAAASAVWDGIEGVERGGPVGAEGAITPAAVKAVHQLRQRMLVSAYEPAEYPGERRYKVTRAARGYARQRLLEMDGANDARRAHAAYYLGLAERLAAECDGGRATEALRGLRIELPNITAVLHRALRVEPATSASALRALTAAAAVWPYVDVGGRYADFGEMADRTLQHALPVIAGDQTADHRALREAWTAVAVCVARALMRGAAPDLPRARALLDEARVVAVTAEDERAIGLVAAASGEYQLAAHTPTRATAFLELAQASLPPSGERLLAAIGLATIAHRTRRLESAHAALTAIAEQAETNQHIIALAHAQLALGALCIDLESPQDAAQRLRVAFATFERLGDGTRAARTLLELGRLAATTGDGEQARALVKFAAEQLRRVGREDLVAGFSTLLT